MVTMPTTLSDHPSLVGIIRFPMCDIVTEEIPVPLVIKDDQNNFMSMRQPVLMATEITRQEKTSSIISISKNTMTDFFPYTYYVLSDGEVEPLIMHPQYLPSQLTIKGKFALSHQPIERYYAVGYKGDQEGLVYNITNLNQMMLPTATNEGLSYMNANANTINQNRRSQVTGNVLNAVSTVASAIATGGMSLIGGGVANIINGLQAVKETDARNRDALLTPNSISSFGTPSTRQAFNSDKVQLLKYSASDLIKQKVIAFKDRYGNKYNNYATIDLKGYKGYVKFIAPDIDSKIDNMHITKIHEILERGIYFE